LLLVALAGVWFGRLDSTADARVSVSPAAPLAQPLPVAPPAGRVQLPALNALAGQDVCSALVSVQNTGADFAKVLLVAFGEHSGSCAPDCIGPLAVECSGLLRPGSSWSFLGAQVPTGAYSGVLFSFNAKRLSEIGGVDGPDDLAADHLCAAVFAAATGNCEMFDRFVADYDIGQVFDPGLGFTPVNLAAARGGPIAVQVLRSCPVDGDPGRATSSGYAGLPAAALWPADATSGPYAYVAPALHAAGQRQSWLIIQPAASGCATVTVWLQEEGACEAVRCEPLTIAAGESAAFEVAGCVDDGWAGSGWVESDHPLAVVVDTTVQVGELMSYTALTADGGRSLQPATGESGPTLFGPILFEAGALEGTGLHVQNRSPSESAQVRVTYLDPSGAPRASEDATICARGSRRFDIPTITGVSRPQAGSVRVESLAGAGGGAAPISAVAEIARGPNAETLIASELLGEPLSFGWPAGEGVAVLAAPLAWNDLSATGVTGELVVTNLVGEPGGTDIALLLYDANALAAVLCRRLDAGQAEHIDLATLPGVVSGFRGGALISATQWTHRSSGAADRPLVGLAALVLAREGTVLGEGIPGDELAAAPAIPLAAGTPYEGWAAPAPLCPEGGPPRPTPTPGPTPDAPHQAAFRAQLHVPVLSFLGFDDVCSAQLTIRNAGSEPAKVALVVWGEAGFCAPRCAGPLKVECSGLLAAGETWVFGEGSAAPLPAGSTSANLYSLSTRTLDELGIEPGSDEIAADRLCESLVFDAVGTCDGWRAFEVAFQEGLAWSEVPLARVRGPAISAHIERHCPGSRTPGTTAVASYDAIPHAAAVAPSAGAGAAAGSYAYWLPTVYSDHAGRRSILYLQNAGRACTTVQVEFVDGAVRQACSVFTLEAGETYPFYADDCVGPEFEGYTRVRSVEPLAIVADIEQGDTLRSHGAATGAVAFDLNGDGRLDAADLAVLEAALGRRHDEPGWDAVLDLVPDGVIDGLDSGRLRAVLGLPAPTPTDTGPRLTPSPTATGTAATPEAGTPSPTPDGQPTTPRPTTTIYLPAAESS
jgi:hypothetical protein